MTAPVGRAVAIYYCPFCAEQDLRRTYTQSHLDYVADCFTAIKSRADKVRGYKFTYAPELLRHFTARFEPL